MQSPFPVHIGPNAIAALIDYVRQNRLRRFLMVADHNTYDALGRRAQEALSSAGCDVAVVLLNGDEVVADESHLVQVLLQAEERNRTYIAVGSGTITDITRFVSHRTGVRFISLPTAPSVDGFASVNAPLVINRFKRTFGAQAPMALFADLPTLCSAPRPMIAAGFGDILGKYTALADWRLGNLLWGEPYDPETATRSRQALDDCVAQVDSIAEASEAGIHTLMEGLITSGLSILAFGRSHPASGAEHHLSHFWEMLLLRQGRPAILHGAKVGVGCILVARRYEQIRQMGAAEARRRLAKSRPPNLKTEAERIRSVYGPVADQVIDHHRAFLDIPLDRHASLVNTIEARWDDIHALAATVPSPTRLYDLLQRVGGPTTVRTLGLTDKEGRLAEQHAHYLRPRFTVMKLARMLGMP